MRALVACALAFSAAATARAGSAAAVAIGDLLPDRTLADAAGGQARLLGGARASVLVLLRTESAHSYAALRELSFIERDYEGKGVRFAAVISGADDVDAARAMLKRAGVRMPLLVDAGDALAGELRVRSHPAVGVTDGKGRLAAFENFRQVGFRQIVRGRLRLALGEMTAAEMDRLLAPSAARTGDELAPARRRVALGGRQLAHGDAAGAQASARRAIALAPAWAPAHVLLGRALAAEGRCRESRAAFAEALRLAPGDAAAREGPLGCAGK